MMILIMIVMMIMVTTTVIDNDDNKAIIGAFVAFQIIIPTLILNPSTSLADAIPLVGTKAPDFSLPSNAGMSY